MFARRVEQVKRLRKQYQAKADELRKVEDLLREAERRTEAVFQNGKAPNTPKPSGWNRWKAAKPASGNETQVLNEILLQPRTWSHLCKDRPDMPKGSVSGCLYFLKKKGFVHSQARGEPYQITEAGKKALGV